MNILFLVPYPLKESPSQRFRFEQYFEFLSKEGHIWTTQSFLDSHNWRLFFKIGKPHKKALTLLKGFGKRIVILFQLHRYDMVFVHREVTPVGPPVFEWIISKVFRKKIIYDFDDAIWLTDRNNEPWWLSLIKWRSKVKKICQWSHRVSCGNEYLRNYAHQFNTNTIYNPTTIDTSRLHTLASKSGINKERITIGWTGSHSTLKYLDALVPVISRLEKKYLIRFLVIADRQPYLPLSTMEFRPWNPETEIEDLRDIDIGIMPLPDDEWSKGKCGFKALQYMALEIPTVAANVGINPSIIEHGVDGFLATTDREWEECLVSLISDSDLRTSLGKNGRVKVIQRYSVDSNVKVFLSLFE